MFGIESFVRARRLAALALLSLAVGGAAAQSDPVRVLFDTDMGPDSDDAGALAVLHALADAGEAEILGTMCGTTSPWCAPAIDVVNTYYGRPDVPTGTLKGEGSAGGSDEWYGASFNAYLAGRFPNRTRHGEYAPDAVALYRRILAAQPDSSVAVVATGPVSNLRHLLASAPDSLSPLGGRALVARKVRHLTVMGGRFPEGGESNFMVDPEATRRVAADWPAPVTFSGFEIGEEVLTGPRLGTETPEGNPVAVAYHLWDLVFARRFEPDFEPESGIWPHSSYDQTAVLHAVRGLRDYWTVVRGRVVIHDDGSNGWEPDPVGPHAYLVEKMPREGLARIIEDLMVASPSSD